MVKVLKYFVYVCICFLVGNVCVVYIAEFRIRQILAVLDLFEILSIKPEKFVYKASINKISELGKPICKTVE